MCECVEMGLQCKRQRIACNLIDCRVVSMAECGSVDVAHIPSNFRQQKIERKNKIYYSFVDVAVMPPVIRSAAKRLKIVHFANDSAWLFAVIQTLPFIFRFVAIFLMNKIWLCSLFFCFTHCKQINIDWNRWEINEMGDFFSVPYKNRKTKKKK